MNRQECPHLLDTTGEVAMIQCASCAGNVRQKFPIHGCAIASHPLCLPTFRGEPQESLQQCYGCPDNPANIVAAG